ncbi:hypothetical protein PV10_08235 [Exophiala mesophila]|uniref:Heterokaryon incompatibility domain-containing protein n=1 Tax=Exophiala mesophila TaxID=212818 RepID=A0A0D1Z3W0_EXOME|nr:uncharacterized protein PV10_08235 [Exophiala mesophila]KIV88564.1 hypothetical protein PV10_08235 [Exophiala mesophila]
MGVGRQVPIDPKLAIFRARSWLQDCLKNHEKARCNTARHGIPHLMPRRLLHVGKSQNQVKLVDNFAGIQHSYVALSYCWGETRHVVTTRSNYTQQLQCIPWSALPATYRDAIEVTRALGFTYIWIDALCIVQGDEQDWNAEAARMSDIYGEAVVVISAVNANHVGFGCLNERPGSRSFKNKLKRNDHDPTHLLVQEPTIHENVLGTPSLEAQWPLFRRAWTLQERILASRILHLSAGEMIWECASICACECGHLESTTAVTSRRRYDLARLESMTTLERANAWDELALSYQNRHITKDNDRLPALSGLAHRFQTDGLGQFLAGLWSEFAISMMLWEVRKGRVSGASVAPSWSWASVQGLLTRNDPIEENNSFQAVLKDFHCDPATSDPYGAIVQGSGYLQLHSPVLDGTIVRSKTNSHMMIRLSLDIFAFFVNDSPIEESLVGATVKCLFVRGLETAPSGRYVEAVVLSLSRDLEHYRRIGIAHLRKHDINRASQQSLYLSMEIVTIR